MWTWGPQGHGRAGRSRVESSCALPPVCPEQSGPTPLWALFLHRELGPASAQKEPPPSAPGALQVSWGLMPSPRRSSAPMLSCSRHPDSPGRTEGPGGVTGQQRPPALGAM